MGHDDRERNFEKALARNLRMNAAVAGAPKKVCADAEVLAAYHEQRLDSEQLTIWKAHISGCPRCMGILANLGATDEIPFHESQAVTRLAQPIELGYSPARTARQARWLWLAPVGALAAGLLAWVVVHQRPIDQVEVAKNQQPAASVPSDITRSASAPSTEERSVSGAPAQGKLNAAIRRDEDRSKSQARTDESKSLRLTSPAPSPQAPKRTDALNAVVAPPGIGREQHRGDKNDGAVAGQRQNPNNQPSDFAFAPAVKLQAPAPALPAKPSASTETVEVTTAAPESSVAAHKKEVAGMEAMQSRQQPERLAGRSLYKVEPGVRLASTTDATTISAPGGPVRWRVGPAGIIEYSSDAGANWSLQPSGVVADLLSGSAPSDKICWIVGRAGTILRTLDGGTHWQQVHAPVEDDVISIFAVNGQEATVSVAQGSYKTMDGGATWNKLKPE